MPDSSRKPYPRQFFSKHTYIHAHATQKSRDPPVAYPEPRTPNQLSYHPITIRRCVISGEGIRMRESGKRDSLVGGSARRRGVALHQVSGLVWSGLVWSGLVWSGLVWSGLVWSTIPETRFPVSPFPLPASLFPLPASRFLIIEKKIRLCLQ